MAGLVDSTVHGKIGYGAIAYSESTGQFRTSWGWATQAEAEAAALDHCPGTDSKIVVSGSNVWLALATGPDGSYVADWNYTARHAGNSALNICRRYHREAVVIVCINARTGPA